MSRTKPFFIAAVAALAACLSNEPPATRIALDTIVELQTSYGPGEISEPPVSVVHLRDRRYFVVAGQITDWSAPIFGPDGEWTDSLGAHGEGPGEYRSIDGAILSRGDSVVIASDLELLTLDPLLRPVRRATLQVQPLRLWSDSAGNILVMGFRSAPESRGARLHLHGPEGVFLKSFSSVDSGLVDAEAAAVSDGGTGWWSAPMVGDYRIDHWNPDGRSDYGHQIAAEWHPQSEDGSAARMGPDTPPPPRVQGLSLASDGRLWVLGTVAAPGWKAALAAVDRDEGPEGGGNLVFVSPDELLDGVIDLLDPGSGVQDATLNLPELVFPLSGDTLYTAREDSSGFWHVTVVRARLDG